MSILLPIFSLLLEGGHGGAVTLSIKPGGKLVYSTCTVNVQENQDQRQWFLENFPFAPVSLTEILGERINEETLRDGYVQLLPGVYPCDGFFIAVFRKI